jgi:hypothetical protein
VPASGWQPRSADLQPAPRRPPRAGGARRRVPGRPFAALAAVDAPRGRGVDYLGGRHCGTAHEIVVHCADSETNAHGRIRYLIAEPEPLIVGYDQARWAAVFAYHDRPLEPAFATVAAVRANTVALLRALPEEA